MFIISICKPAYEVIVKQVLQTMSLTECAFLDDISSALTKAVNTKFLAKMADLRRLLHEQADLDPELVDFLVNQQSYQIKTRIRPHQTKQSRSKKVSNDDARCMARIAVGDQCSRQRLEAIEYCKGHMHIRPYGRIDTMGTQQKSQSSHRRRRRRVHKIKNMDYKVSDLDMTQYIQSIYIEIEGRPYLLDEHGVVYEYSTDNIIMGMLRDNLVTWY